jgi:hypothetical protein
MSKKKKPSKRQEAIISFLGLIESEGLHYGLVKHGCKEDLKLIKNKTLTKLVEEFGKITDEIEAIVSELEAEVEPFTSDDSDF